MLFISALNCMLYSGTDDLLSCSKESFTVTDGIDLISEIIEADRDTFHSFKF